MKNTSKPSQIDPAPRYHARDAAVVLASFYKAKVLLGSTPVLKPILTVSLENMV
jgi:primosomal protein N' (replication factor Y)